jgi:polysaccharide export outer membrane protein
MDLGIDMACKFSRRQLRVRIFLTSAWMTAAGVLCSAQLAQPERNTLSATDYVVGRDDVLSIQVWNQPSLSGKFMVDPDGTLNFPLVGRIAAGGLSVSQVGSSLAKQLAVGYVKDPHVSVTVEQYRSRQIVVTGEVKQPGRYVLTGRSTLLETLAHAGSATPTAGSEVLVFRRAAGDAGASKPSTEEAPGNVIRVDLAALEAGVLTNNIEVLDGDTIVVPKAEVVFVFGQVRSPGSYAIRKGTTVLQALALAGGLTDRGSDRRIRIVRATANGDKQERKVTLQDLVQDGDSIIVEERVF